MISILGCSYKREELSLSSVQEEIYFIVSTPKKLQKQSRSIVPAACQLETATWKFIFSSLIHTMTYFCLKIFLIKKLIPSFLICPSLHITMVNLEYINFIFCMITDVYFKIDLVNCRQNVKSHVKNHHKMSVAQRSAVIREIVEASGGQIKTKMRDAGKKLLKD